MRQRIDLLLIIITTVALISCQKGNDEDEGTLENESTHCDCEKQVQTLVNGKWSSVYGEPQQIFTESGNCAENNDTTLIAAHTSGGYYIGELYVPMQGGERWVVLCPPPVIDTVIVIINPDTIPTGPIVWNSSCHCRLVAKYQIYNGFNWYDAGPTFGKDYTDWTACDDQAFINANKYVLYDYQTVQTDVFRFELKYINYYLMNIDNVNTAVSSPPFDC